MVKLKNNKNKLIREGVCPVCAGKLVHKEGCIECSECGWSFCEEA